MCSRVGGEEEEEGGRQTGEQDLDLDLDPDLDPAGGRSAGLVAGRLAATAVVSTEGAGGHVTPPGRRVRPHRPPPCRRNTQSQNKAVRQICEKAHCSDQKCLATRLGGGETIYNALQIWKNKKSKDRSPIG